MRMYTYKLINDYQNVCECLTLNEMHIELAYLIICSINYNLTKTSSTPLPEKKSTIMYSKFNNFMYFKSNFHLLKVKNKTLNLF